MTITLDNRKLPDKTSRVTVCDGKMDQHYRVKQFVTASRLSVNYRVKRCVQILQPLPISGMSVRRSNHGANIFSGRTYEQPASS